MTYPIGPTRRKNPDFRGKTIATSLPKPPPRLQRRSDPPSTPNRPSKNEAAPLNRSARSRTFNSFPEVPSTRQPRLIFRKLLDTFRNETVLSHDLRLSLSVESLTDMFLDRQARPASQPSLSPIASRLDAAKGNGRGPTRRRTELNHRNPPGTPTRTDFSEIESQY